MKRSQLMYFTMSAIAIASFLLAYARHSQAAMFIFIHLVCIVYVATKAQTAKQYLVSGAAIGFGTVVPTLWFFWGMIHEQAMGLWVMLALWQAIPIWLAAWSTRRWEWTKWLIPFAWTLALYARCELYPLRFAMATPIHALTGLSSALLHFGGFGFVFIILLAAVSMSRVCDGTKRFSATAFWLAFVCGAALIVSLIGYPYWVKDTDPYVAGVQIEAGALLGEGGKPILQFLPEQQVIEALDKCLDSHPELDIAVLPEYAIPGAPGQKLMDWARSHQRCVVVGGKRLLPDGSFRNTAFVIDSSGKLVFEQAKAQPVTGLPDGMPAETQDVWNSKWGKIGIAICYDLSLSRVTDGLVHQGARAIICPAMDLSAWGKQEHELNARFATIRAAEYSIPVFRLASSGTSQLVYPDGMVVAEALYSASSSDMRTLGGKLPMGAGHLPIDRRFLSWLPSAAHPLLARMVAH